MTAITPYNGMHTLRFMLLAACIGVTSAGEYPFFTGTMRDLRETYPKVPEAERLYMIGLIESQSQPGTPIPDYVGTILVENLILAKAGQLAAVVIATSPSRSAQERIADNFARTSADAMPASYRLRAANNVLALSTAPDLAVKALPDILQSLRATSAYSDPKLDENERFDLGGGTVRTLIAVRLITQAVQTGAAIDRTAVDRILQAIALTPTVFSDGATKLAKFDGKRELDKLRNASLNADKYREACLANWPKLCDAYLVWARDPWSNRTVEAGRMGGQRMVQKITNPTFTDMRREAGSYGSRYRNAWRALNDGLASLSKQHAALDLLAMAKVVIATRPADDLLAVAAKAYAEAAGELAIVVDADYCSTFIGVAQSQVALYSRYQIVESHAQRIAKP